MLKLKDGFTGERCIVLPKMIIEMEQADPLVSSLYITDIGYYPAASHHYRERKKPIEQNVLIYCVQGAGWYKIGDGKEQQVSANQFFILPADKPHIYATLEHNPWTIYWIHFSGNHAHIFAEGAAIPQNITPAMNSRINERNTLFEEIYLTLENGYARENLRYASSLLHYYLATMRYLSLYRISNATEKKEDKVAKNDIVHAAIHYMKENLEQKLSLQAIADYTGYSGSHFSMIFKKEVGHSPLNYFNLLKVQYACKLLSKTDMRINQICFKVGISDSYYFSRLFIKLMGMSPKEYRKRIQEP
ncbi:MAG: helix-turn-helix domain-containing protein [Prevotella sp.]|jgi:AraC family transcriptional regulator of arabinose operon